MTYDLDHCKICKKPLPPLVAAMAHDQIEEKACSPECRMKEHIQRFACCEQAVVLPCVCHASFRCPVHGDRHIGTHD
jgi:hypothetical protein